MSLTKETLRTPLEPGSYPSDVNEDITHMDHSQLEAFIRGLVLRERHSALDFLPAHFWREPFDVGPDIEHSAGGYLSGLSNIVYLALEGKFTRHDGRKLDFDPLYRTRIQQVMVNIANECLGYEGSPTKKELLLAQVVIDAAEGLRGNNPIYLSALRLVQDTRYSTLKNLERIR